MRRPRSLRTAFAVVLALTAPACGNKSNNLVKVLAIGQPAEPFAGGVRLAPPGQLVRAATAEGLVGFDAQGRVIPALADRWIVTDDGQTYIFRLRDGTWRDGSPLTGESARAALRQALLALRGTALGLDLAPVDEVRAMAARVVEIRLAQPMPDFLQLLAQPELGLLRRGEGAGPMALARSGDVALLTPIPPDKLGLPAEADWAARARSVRLEAVAAETAVQRFGNGQADVVLGGRVETFPRATAAGLTRGAIRIDPVAGLFGLVVLREDGFLATPENREALALAIDREGLIGALGVGGWTPTTRIVAPGSEGDGGVNGERWTALNLAQRRAAAAERVRRWQGGRNPPLALRIALPQGPGADILFARLQGDFAVIGVQAARVPLDAPADLRLLDAVARFPRIDWYLNQLSCAILRGLCSPAADATVAAAAATVEPAGRTTLLAQAEAELTAVNVFIPFGPPIRWSLVSGNASGFTVNRVGVHPLMALAMRPG
ncbi:MAG: ABC transporter substrate-binding protein [Novosphingobium sp.]|nr:ABC transporter substrate-binding protein [Novosphingobium sp.]